MALTFDPVLDAYQSWVKAGSFREFYSHFILRPSFTTQVTDLIIGALSIFAMWDIVIPAILVRLAKKGAHSVQDGVAWAIDVLDNDSDSTKTASYELLQERLGGKCKKKN